MKLHDALRELCEKHGNIIVQKKNLVYLLSDLGAFEECPELRQIMKDLVSGGYTRDLYQRSLRKNKDDYLSHAYAVLGSFRDKKDTPNGLALYAVNSVSFMSEQTEEGGAELPDSDEELPSAILAYPRSLMKAWQGDAEAQGIIGDLCLDEENGDGRYNALGLKWHLKAAESGNARSQLTAGKLYLEGAGIKHDYAEALKWFRKAAEQGNANAMRCIGRMYENGDGVARDYKMAAEWYQKAAELKDEMAGFYLGMMYENGHGVARSHEKALDWFKKTAEQSRAENEAILRAVKELESTVSRMRP